jgi:hypothetical protein
MLDLDGAGRRLATFRAGVPTPLLTIERRARRRRRGRRAVGGAAAIALVAGVIVAGFHLVPAPRGQGIVVRGGPATTAPVTHTPAAPPIVAAPKGWFRHDIGLLAFDTPNWGGGSTRSSYTMGPCPDRDHCTITSDLIARASVPTAGLTPTSINGLAVWETTRGPVRIYDVPSTGIELLLRGADARGIARTLQPSAAADVLAAHYPLTLPADWKSVTYDGVTLQVPPSWAVRYPQRSDRAAYGSNGCSVPAGSTIYLGSFSADCSTEEATFPYGPWLWLGQETGRYTGHRLTLFSSDDQAVVATGTPGVRITLPYGAMSGPLPALTIQTATGTVHAQLEISQSSPVLEEEILSSIRPAGQ